jgi:hypothetical protein
VSRKGASGTKVKKAFLTLVVLALLAVALQSLVFSGASFTSSSGNPGNTFTAGTFGHTNSKDGVLVIDAAGLWPGASKTGTLTIAGIGDFSGAYTLTKAGVVDTPPAVPGLSNALTLRIEDITTGAAVTLSNTTVAGFNTVSVGAIASGASRQYRFTLTYPTAAANAALQGASMTLRLQFTGVTQ